MLTIVFVWLLIYKGQSHSNGYPSCKSMNIMRKRPFENAKNSKDFTAPCWNLIIITTIMIMIIINNIIFMYLLSIIYPYV